MHHLLQRKLFSSLGNTAEHTNIAKNYHSFWLNRSWVQIKSKNTLFPIALTNGRGK